MTQHTVWPDADVPSYINGHHTQQLLRPEHLHCVRGTCTRRQQLQESGHTSKPPAALLGSFPSPPHLEFFLGRGDITVSSFSSTCEMTVDSDNKIVRNNIESPRAPVTYLAPIVVSCKTVV